MTARFAAERRIVDAVWNRKALWVLHLLGNAALLASIYFWLWIPDRTVTDLVLSAAAGLVIVLLGLWLHSSTLSYFRAVHETGNSNLWSSFQTSLKRLPATLIWGLAAALVAWIIMRAAGYQDVVSNRVASFLTLQLQRPVSPLQVSTMFSWTLFLIAFVLAPIILLPLFNWLDVTRALQPLRRVRYWVACFILLLAGFVITYGLVNWTPAMNSLTAESISALARFLAAYAFGVTVWLLMASAVGLWSASELKR